MFNFEINQSERDKNRKFVGKIVMNVLIEKISVKEGLLLFPKNDNDTSIQVAWHALLHFEADADMRQKDNLYEKEQINYLEFISNTLQDGNQLPKNIIQKYLEYYKDTPLPHTTNFEGILGEIKRNLNL